MAAHKGNVHSKLEQRAFLLCLVLVTLLFFYLLKPFFAALFWACAIGLLFYPVRVWLDNRWGKRPNSHSLITLLLCMVVVVLPVLGLLSSVFQEAAQLYQRMDAGEIRPETYIDRVRDALPQFQVILDRAGIESRALRDHASQAAVAVSQFVAKNAVSVGQSTFQFFLHLCLMLYVTYFLLRDGPRLVELLVRALPLGDERERLLFRKFAEVTRATIKGNLVVAVVQGALGGLIFAILSIPGAVLWGVVMAFLSLLPAVGAGLIWGPVAIYLFATGEVIQGMVLVVYGLLVIGLADNILRPILVGRDTKMPDWLVLLSTLGGLVTFGINGFVIGPLIAALFIAFWQIFSRDFSGKDIGGVSAGVTEPADPQPMDTQPPPSPPTSEKPPVS
ncbi:MAG TPA: AI-2E family transporter [Porticoccaceae bacterium]